MAIPSGRQIVTELRKEMEERLYPLLYRTLPPSVFHVYLQPDDYRHVEAIVPLIVADAQQGLDARVEEINRQSRWSALRPRKDPPIEIPPSGWEVHVHPDTNGELLRGELGIESRLSVPPPPRYEGGTPTTRIGRTVVTGALRRSRPAESTPLAASVTADAPAVPVPSVPSHAPGPGTPAATVTVERPPDVTSEAPGGGRTAHLSYVDESGPHLFVMRKELISIGRGGSAHWVDVQVVSTPRVSREHCRIRRAPDGRFLLQDVSTWGTSVDGMPVTPFARHLEGRVEETGAEHELPRRARIRLADAVEISFRVEP